MPTEIYKSTNVETIDGQRIYITPLKIKYMKQFMNKFEEIKFSEDDSESMEVLAECCAIAMQQYYPELSTPEAVEDSFDMDTIYTIIDFGAGITLRKSEEDQAETQPLVQKQEKPGSSWEDLDLAKLESEAFLLGIWKDYEELETCLSMQELTAILEQKRDEDYQDKKFMAAMQGVDLDEQSGRKEEDPWESMKARVAAKVSGIENSGGNDIASFVGQRAARAGFGIGHGLSYEKT